MSFKRKLSLIAVVLITIIAISTASTPFALSAESSNSESLYELFKDDPLLFDAAIYAKYHGVTVNEAIRRFELQDAAGELDAELSSKEVETFAGLWIEHTPEFRIVVLFTRDAEETIRPYLQKELTDIVEVRIAEKPLIDLQNVQAEVSSSLKNLGIPVDSESNVYENRVKVYVVDRVQLDDALQNGRLILPDYIDVITVESLGTLETDIYGGLSLTTCTSGFAVKTAGGTKGITTAGHCSNTQSHSGETLPFQSQAYGTSYDIQWHTAPDFTVTNKIKWWSDGSTRDITATKSRSNQSVGMYVAKYGKTSGYTAGYISSKTYQPTSIPDATATFIRVDNTGDFEDLSSAGDSGGPWFNLSTAYGSHSGSPAGDSNDAFYMAINYVSGIGVSVMTSP